MKILDRYILRELAGPFLFGVGVFSVLLVAGFILPKLTELFAESRMSVGRAALFFVYSLPRYLMFTFSMASLLAVLTAFGRLSAESEMVAFHAAGASLPRLAVPGILFGAVISIIALGMGEFIVPPANHAADLVLGEATRQVERVQDNYTFATQPDAKGLIYEIHADEFNPAARTMQHVTIIWVRKAKPTFFVYADQAEYENDKWWLHDGFSNSLGAGPFTFSSFPITNVDYLASPDKLAQAIRENPADLSYRELGKKIAVLYHLGQDATKYEVELPRRIALPFAALVFALIGTPLGMRSHRRSSSLGVALTVLIIFLYYIVWNWLSTTAQSRALLPALAAWIPNIGFALAGLILIFTARK